MSSGMLFQEPVRRYFKVNKKDIAYLRFITEAYEGLSTLSTHSRENSTIVISYTKDVAADMEGLIDALIEETGMIEVEV